VSSEREPEERGEPGRTQLALELPVAAVPAATATVGEPAVPAATAGELIDFGRAGEPDRVVCGDALDELVTTGDGVLDAIYIDPPFGTGSVQRGRGHAYADRTDEPDAFVAWLAPYLEHSRRVLRTTGSLFVHLDYRAVHYVKIALDRLFGRDRFVNEIVWCYAVGGKNRRGFGRKHDTILWYVNSTDWAFYADAVRVPRRGGSHMRVVGGVQEKTDRKTGRVYRYPIAAGKVPEDWWTDIETLNHSDRERTGWPSQKPERLVERLLRAVTVEGDRVADWFAGSGTTAAVAQRLGRRFVVADREPAAIDVAVARLTRQGRRLEAEGAPPAPICIVRRQADRETHLVPSTCRFAPGR
jgi:DNA modification methylase